ncbi:MAG TPA: monovalent cation/H+ antiporter subunit D family protein [Candidatus Acidoferrales bacterium]|nr:monovalent cation/H+ antiporter subunit D family protein [Candidatus Acidoferrales bacterium]
MPIFRSAEKPWVLSLLTTWAVFGMTVLLLLQLSDRSQSPDGRAVISYAIGNWMIPWGIELRIDRLNGFVLLVIAMISAIVTFYARLSVAQAVPQHRIPFFYSVWLLFITGLLGVAVSGDIFNVYVMIEISALASYTLVAMGQHENPKALLGSINYLVLGTIGASFFLIGVGYLYSVTGTLNMADLAERLKPLHGNRALITAFAFILVGLSVKMALFPLHGWLPDAHGYAPPIVSALLSGVAIKVAAYVMIRLVFSLLGMEFSFSILPTGPVIWVLSSLAIVIGSYTAIQQTSLKRLLAYSSVAQIGYIAMGLSLANENGLTGSLVHVFNHALMKSGLFLVAGIVSYRLGAADLELMAGLGRKMPFTMSALVAGGLGLIGVPLTSGFVSKWYLVSGAIDRGAMPLALVILLGSILAVMYIWKVLEIVYFRPSLDSARAVTEAPWSLVLPAWILIGASLYFGVDASLPSGLAEHAARFLLEQS